MGILVSARGFLSATALVDARHRGRISPVDAVFHEHFFPAPTRAISIVRQLGLVSQN